MTKKDILRAIRSKCEDEDAAEFSLSASFYVPGAKVENLQAHQIFKLEDLGEGKYLAKYRPETGNDYGIVFDHMDGICIELNPKLLKFDGDEVKIRYKEAKEYYIKDYFAVLTFLALNKAV